MYKHAEIDAERHDQQLDEISVSTGAVVGAMNWPTHLADSYLRGTVVVKQTLVETEDGPAVCTTYIAPKFIYGTDRRRFLDIAELALNFWRKFDPAAGPNQVI
jgi:hypothetical protein